MKLFQCSKCARLDINDVDDKCFFTCGADPRPRYRDKYDKAACETDFRPLEGRQWHEKFSWEVREK